MRCVGRSIFVGRFGHVNQNISSTEQYWVISPDFAEVQQDSSVPMGNYEFHSDSVIEILETLQDDFGK